MDIVIMAGGKGTRIASINAEVPKPMIRILGKPILEYQIECLREQGYHDFIIIIGHLGHVVKEYFGDGSFLGVSIEYIEETEPLGTAGALYYLKNRITEDFLLINGDVIFDIDVKRFKEKHVGSGATVTLFTHPNNHPYDSGIIIADVHDKVINWLHKEDERQWYKNRVNAGIHMISPTIFTKFNDIQKLDLDRDILKPMIFERNLYIYDSPEYVKDMGTPARYYEVENDIQNGKVKAKNLREKQRAIFLDRDGTINKYVGFLTKVDQFELLKGTAEAIRKINESGYLVIVITNQPVIARGEVTWEELTEIHNKMETLLGMHGAYIDDILVCPHHPNKGYSGERLEYKIECECRKPKPGLIIKAARKYNIDLSNSFMIGDNDIDIEAGIAAGCSTIKIKTDNQDLYSIIDKIQSKILI